MKIYHRFVGQIFIILEGHSYSVSKISLIRESQSFPISQNILVKFQDSLPVHHDLSEYKEINQDESRCTNFIISFIMEVHGSMRG